ncbi:MAG: energy transducer TonB [Burkholderiaceae bacterium]
MAATPPPPVAAPVESAAPRPAPVTPTVRLAPRDPALEQWKRTAAEKIHTVNRIQTFEGRPHHLLKAVIVVEVAVDRSGQVTRSKVLRSPGIKSLDEVALASLKKASPLPPPPSALVAKGPLVFSETWLFQNDGRFQVRTLAMAQE